MQKQVNRLNHLVSVRGLAAWLVVFYHSLEFLRVTTPGLPEPIFNIISHGHMAVDFFFVLSGFIIFINYYHKFQTTFLRNIREFYWNRFSRVYPVHILMLGAYLCLAIAFLNFSASQSLPPTYNTQSFLQNAFLIHAWQNNLTSWNVPSWSISAEWFVYLLFPIIAVFFEKFLKGIISNIIFSIFLLITAQALIMLQPPNSDYQFIQLPLVRVTHEFLLGSIAGSIYIYHHDWLVKYQPFLLVIVGLIFCSNYFLNIPSYIVLSAICFLAILWMSTDKSWVTKALHNRVLVYLGEISYSTYMVHYFVKDIFKAGWVKSSYEVDASHLYISFFVVFFLSIAMHHMIEMPAQRYLRKIL